MSSLCSLKMAALGQGTKKTQEQAINRWSLGSVLAQETEDEHYPLTGKFHINLTAFNSGCGSIQEISVKGLDSDRTWYCDRYIFFDTKKVFSWSKLIFGMSAIMIIMSKEMYLVLKTYRYIIRVDDFSTH